MSMSGIDRNRLRGCAAGLVLALAPSFGPGTALAQTPAEQRCERSVQDRIAWDYAGNKRWAPANLRRLCKGATDPSQPGRCFARVMHGGISWGGGTRWRWQNALDLCEGTGDAERTVGCFQRRIAAGDPWREAIGACTTALLELSVPQPVAPEVLRPVPSPQGSGGETPGGGGAGQAASRTILPDGTVEISYPDGRRNRFYKGGETRILPDGSQQTLAYSTAARPPIPPAVPDTAETAWLEEHSERLLSMIGRLVGGDPTAIANYLQFEGSAAGVYEQILKREETLTLLLKD